MAKRIVPAWSPGAVFAWDDFNLCRLRAPIILALLFAAVNEATAMNIAPAAFAAGREDGDWTGDLPVAQALPEPAENAALRRGATDDAGRTSSAPLSSPAGHHPSPSQTAASPSRIGPRLAGLGNEPCRTPPAAQPGCGMADDPRR
ncbi:hypothetical protein [Erythrobacter tepidarius]|uniref:hypothetical protein n=1 Tax=Erythrobacter tepidarius TaxID=60454 RepID=UPI000A3B8686|nr:hypothetical protein [Erythrobacter tepidarius]